jgi:hypothetical protein
MTIPTLTREDFLARFDVRTDLRQVDLPDGSRVFIRQLTGAGADAFGAASLKSPELARSTLVVACVCDATGTPLFTMGEATRVAELPNRVLNPIVEAIIDHNGLRAEAAAAAVPTSASGRSNRSGSASPATWADQFPS